jgi:lysophospholipase L1-like esterase
MKIYHLLAALCAVFSSSSASAQGLSIGTFTAVGVPNGITLSVSSGLAGGTNAGYSYLIYRDIQPVVSTSGAPLASATSLPYTDTSAAEGILYFYKIVGKDGGSNVVYAAPAGLTGVGVSTSADLSVAAQRPSGILNVVYGGDSITYGANLSDPADDSPPVAASADLRAMIGVRAVFFSNQGHGGHTTTDFLPTSGGDFQGIEQAARLLENANPTGQLVFSLMLGTNDSATSGTHGSARTPEQVMDNLEIIVDRLLIDFPNAKVVVHYPPCYSPNTHNGANYEEAGLARLISYYPAIDKTVAYEDNRHRGHVYVGDRTAPAYFAAVYQTELTPEQGQNGTFYLHPNKLGAAALGRLWAEAIYQGLYGNQRR